MGYCTEEDVYEATGFTESVVRSLSSKQKAGLTQMITRFIDKGDRKIKRCLGIPITIRKEDHAFEKSETLELGPYEDEFEFFGTWDPEDCVEKIYALYLAGGDRDIRVKLPYPRDCDVLTEDIDDMAGTNVTLTKETVIVKCGDASIKAEFSDAGNFYFPTAGNLQKNIDPWTYVSFWFRTSDNTVIFTLTLEDKDSNITSETFTLEFDDTWELVTINIKSVLADIGWSIVKLQKITISASKLCTIYFDNFNFNDGYFWTCPEGLICWADPNSDPWGKIRVTYSYDPYKVEVPEDIREASAKLAGVQLLDYCIGLRVMTTGFKLMSEDLEAIPEKIALEVARNRLKREAAEILAGIGYGSPAHEGIGTA